jgi:hypothetical protein
VKSYPKPKRIKSESYRRWVASRPCICCGIEGFSQAAHPNGGGMGTKHSDLECFAMCATRPGELGCHAEFDQLIGVTLIGRRILERQYVKQTQDMARAAGRPEIL